NTPDDEITYAVLRNPNGGSRVNLRTGPTTEASIIRDFPVGTPVTVYTYGQSWCYAQISGYNGYVATNFLSFDLPPHPVPNPEYIEYAVVTTETPGSWVNLREQPTTKSRSVGQYYGGTQVTVLNFGSDWSYVEVDGSTGYFMTRYLTFIDVPLYNEYAGDEYDPYDEVQPFEPSEDDERFLPVGEPLEMEEAELFG
ncbi:SH3 domain-containing protein, partial [Eubacteriales bacterium OttesenSCG-928-A19]|nr:SH3 domain-containing protein [Eubacteriales bacterium OttesenSCG-928-A19]